MKPAAAETLNASQICGLGVADMAGTATGVSATSISDTTLSQFVSGLAGRWVTMGGMRALILSETSTSVCALDQWQNPGSSDAAVGPPTVGAYFITAGAAPIRYGAISQSTATPGSGDTALAGELYTAGGGLNRTRVSVTYTPGASSFTMTAAWTTQAADFTAYGSPIDIDLAGWFQSAKPQTGQPIFEESLGASPAPLGTAGDQLTLSNSVAIG